ncbi:MAG: hypothetical protein P4M11_11155 [Candidatus Pacebacteria bacterium]|nr:hypothetical protein [Candidatus Paceibacterota bacterium]
MLFGDLCNSATYFSTYSSCAAFDDGIALKGLTAVLAYFFVLARSSLEKYLQLKAAGTSIASVFDEKSMFDSCIK